MTERHTDPERAKAGEQEHREKDPHGSAPGEHAGKEHPAGVPSSNRHKTETANGEDKKAGR